MENLTIREDAGPSEGSNETIKDGCPKECFGAKPGKMGTEEIYRTLFDADQS